MMIKIIAPIPTIIKNGKYYWNNYNYYDAYYYVDAVYYYVDDDYYCYYYVITIEEFEGNYYSFVGNWAVYIGTE